MNERDAAATATVAVLATLDTKGDEARYLADQLRERGLRALLVDMSLRGASPEDAGVTRADLARLGAVDAGDDDRTTAMETTARAAAERLTALRDDGAIDAVIAVGGGTGGWMAERAVAPLPFGFPKLIVTTVVKATGEHDILYLPSVVDVAGSNALLRTVLRNAAAATAGMLGPAGAEPAPRATIAMTMFGVTTAGGDVARQTLESAGYDVVVFHATGAGGRTMERLLAEGRFAGVLDWTTTELVQHLSGGLCDAGPERLTAAAAAGVAQVVVPGAVDVINVLPPVPERFADRPVHWHLPTVPLVRATAEESARVGEWVASALGGATAPTAVCIPQGGFSSLDQVGGDFADAEADAAFERAVRDGLPETVALHTSPAHINDPEFARMAAHTLLDLLGDSIPKE